MIIEAFNGTYFALVGLIIASAVLITFLLRKKSQDTKRRFVLGICYLNIAIFLVYKFGLWYGTYGLPDDYVFEIWAELPLHLCNVSLFLLPIGIYKRKDFLLAYGVFIVPLGALLAITFPCEGFGGLNIFYPHMLGFYIFHGMLVLVGILLVSLGLFRPTFRKIPSMFGLILVMSFLAFLLSLLLRTFAGDSPFPPNYFYTVGPEGISILELFWSWIPVSYLYLMPGIVILGVYTCLLTLPFHLRDRAAEKRNAMVAPK